MNCCCVIALFTTPGTGAELAAALCIRSSIILYLPCLPVCVHACRSADVVCSALWSTRHEVPATSFIYIWPEVRIPTVRDPRVSAITPPLPSPSPQDMGNALLNNLEYPWYQGRLSITTELAIRARCHCAVLLFGLFLLCYRWQS